VLRENGSDEELIAEGHTTLACVGNDHAPMRLPNEAVQVLLSRETSTSEVHA
jgi:acyl-CoA thioesterase FadM